MQTRSRKLLKAMFVLQIQIFFLVLDFATSKEKIYVETGLSGQSFSPIMRSKFNFILLFADLTCILHVVYITVWSPLLLFVSIGCN